MTCFWRHKKDATASGEQCLEYNERMTKTRTEHCDSKAFAPKMFARPGNFLLNLFNINIKLTVIDKYKNHHTSMPTQEV